MKIYYSGNKHTIDHDDNDDLSDGGEEIEAGDLLDLLNRSDVTLPGAESAAHVGREDGDDAR